MPSHVAVLRCCKPQGTETAYLVDFSGPPGFAKELAARAGKVVVLDHHKTAAAGALLKVWRCEVAASPARVITVLHYVPALRRRMHSWHSTIELPSRHLPGCLQS